MANSATPTSGRPLPGWGQTLRRGGGRALVLAALGFGSAGCQAAPVTASSLIAFQSAPGTFRAALQAALRHLDSMPRAVSAPFHLVAFTGSGLDENGSSTAAAGSGWSFTFSRYVDSSATPSYEVVTVSIPGSGSTHLDDVTANDAKLSPIENWDAGIDPASPDSKDFLAPLKAAMVSTTGATISLDQGVVTIKAGGKTTTYSTSEGTYSPVQ